MRLRLKILALGSALLLSTVASVAQSFDFVSIDYPNAKSTIANGINPGGDIVGTFIDPSGKQHAFLLSRGAFTAFDFPGALATNARGINAGGEIVGSYIAPPDGPNYVPGSPANIKGFLYSHGSFSTVLFPGHPGAIPQRISPDGAIYGCYHDYDLMGSMFGFVRDRSGYTSINDAAGMLVPASMHNGATPNAKLVVGLYVDMASGRSRGYVLRDGMLDGFDAPGSVGTQAWDVNPSADIVGVFRDDINHKLHGFLRTSSDVYTQIDFPGAVATQAFGINPGGAIVGQYIDSSGKTHGFLAVPTSSE